MTRYLLLAAATAALTFGACSDHHDHDYHDDHHDHMSMNNSSMNQGDQGQVASGDQGANGVVATDSDFVKNAAMGGLYEIKSSQVALQMSQDAHVREVAEMMIRDHTAVGRKLAMIAQTLGVAVPNMPSSQQQDLINRLTSIQGGEFDKEYLSQQQTAHRETIRQFQTEAKSGADEKLREFASTNLPTLQHHLGMIMGTDQNSTAMDR